MEKIIQATDDQGNSVPLTFSILEQDHLGFGFALQSPEGERGYHYHDQAMQERVIVSGNNYMLPHNWRQQVGF